MISRPLNAVSQCKIREKGLKGNNAKVMNIQIFNKIVYIIYLSD